MFASTDHVRHGCALALCLCAFAGANAQSARPPDPLQHLTPQERKAFVQAQAARQRAERAHADAASDITPPVLTKFSSATTFDASDPLGPFKVSVKATDDLSGVNYIYAYAYGPNGQYAAVSVRPGYPYVSMSGLGGFDDYYLPALMYGGNGTWQFDYAYIYDEAGNVAYYDGPALAALGNTTFSVKNSQGADVIAPSLTSGKILTKSVSVAAYVPGTTNPPYVGITLSATDTGISAVSGVSDGHAYFCQVAAPNTCIYLYGSTTATGQASISLTFSTQVYPGITLGVYELQHIHLFDHARNVGYWSSTKFGGTTDFSTMFPSTTIKLKP